MGISIRKANQNEYFATENITREAFWNLFKSGCDEHLVLHQLRKSKSYISELDLVAVLNEEIIGHIISTKAKVVDSHNTEFEVLCVGPLSVLPDFQNKGTGSMLIKHSAAIAKDLGYPGMVLFGAPDYYHRFGFVNTQNFGITTKEGLNFEPFMVLELSTNSLAKVKGKFYEDSAFETTEMDLTEFEKLFPLKEKGIPKIDLSNIAPGK